MSIHADAVSRPARTRPAAVRFLASALLALAAAIAGPAASFAGGSPAASLTEFFEGVESDLAFTSVTFTPDGSGDFYRACREPATAFRVDPAGGSGIGMNDDDVAKVVLADGRTLSLFGVAADTVYVGSNGYVTFGHEDEEYQAGLAEHFDLPRVSVLFDDLDPRAQDRTPVTWQQLPDRFVVTWLDILEHDSKLGQNDNVQAELFFDGRIRLTWLEIHATGALVGLSRGDGIPADYADTDFSALPLCGSCGHEACASGTPLSLSCSSCTITVCSFDGFCCTDTWDSQCIEEARCFCPQTCGCGNGVIQGLCQDPTASVVPETCDDANRSSGDGCSVDCQAEVCGDGSVDAGEQCDDGNNTSDDGCRADCKLEAGYCAVVFGFYDFTNPVGNLAQFGWRALYPGSDARLATVGETSGCESLVAAKSLQYAEGDQDLLKALDVLVDLGDNPVHGPIDIVRCYFIPQAPLVGLGTGFLAPSVTSDAYSGGVDSAQPRVGVTSVTCGAPPPPICGDATVAGDEDCDDGNTDFASGDRCTGDCSFTPCGKPTNSAGTEPLAKDALYILKTAVGQTTCVLEVCDVTDDGKITTSDALRALRRAVGQAVTITCPG